MAGPASLSSFTTSNTISHSSIRHPQVVPMIYIGCKTVFANLHSHEKALVLSFTNSTFLRTNQVLFSVKRNYMLSSMDEFRGAVVMAEGSRRSWDFGKYLKTIFYFSEPLSLQKVLGSILERFTRSEPNKVQSREKESSSDLVLVVGATGGVGKRAVEILQKKGVPVRNVEKARSLLGPNINIVTADITQKSTLLPEYFEGVKRVVNAAAVIVGPKEGDTADRQKYFQGIKFFDPEIKGDTPETVEYYGLKNLIDAVKDHIGVREGRALLSFGENGFPIGPAWGPLDDVVMGGVSESHFQISSVDGENGGPAGIFKGFVSTENNGGFASIRTKNFDPLLDLSAYEGLEVRLKGDGHRFKLVIRTSTDFDAVGYTVIFDTKKNEWQSIRLPFVTFVPIFRARTVKDAPRFNTTKIASLQVMYSKFESDGKLNPTFEPGPFELPISSIRAYLKEPITPRFVHVSSAGVTRPDRPGLDLSKQPPAVRLNKELNYIMTFKLKGEDVLRESGIPYTIVRPCALTEEPAGADLIFEQGDNITGKISREEVARICVAALESPAACDITFEVKSVIPFSQPFTVDSNNPPPERDYEDAFGNLKKGITGKEALENVTLAV
ncbi:hypothetical protein O6H91_11G023700 [Diphasiastrum complanatum]|uniref:Uncharacterized protein n=1 Tax=Diphasiastrum complanatum TaxID=34168 RepID=A0ACC2C732_DIPCM|nr:hypothetical protein O6H91_11G023700 [Diphasiastrum complanatum]